MILWISLSSVLALLLFLITRWIGLSFERDEAGVIVTARFSKLRFTFHPGESGKKDRDEKVSVKDEDREKKEQIKNAVGWLRLASDFSRLVKDAVRFLQKYGRIARLELEGSIGTGDPYLTGTFFGLLETLKGILKQVIPSARIDVRPEFGRERLDLEGAFGVEIRLIHLVFLIMFTVWNLPKRRVWRLVKSR